MSLECLLLTRDDQVIRVLRRVLDEFEIVLHVFTGADKAAEEMERRKFDAVLIDCDDVHNAITVLVAVRLTPANKTSTVFAIVNGITSPTTAIELGANLAIEKPLDEYKARHALKSVHSLMLHERRSFYRHAVDVAVTLRFEDREKKSHRDIMATAVNLSEGGMAVKVKSSLPPGHRSMLLKFAIPGTEDHVEIPGSIAWADEMGNAGLRFEKVPYTLRERLSKFFANADKQQKEHGPEKAKNK